MWRFLLNMKYNLIEIGVRLKTERKKAGFKSHDELVDYIKNHNYRGFTRQTISKWERGLEMPPLDILCSLCELFECELGYLLCEYETKGKKTNLDNYRLALFTASDGLSECIKNIYHASHHEPKKKHPAQ